MAGRIDELLVVAWIGWGIQVMVLLSFTVQVTLFLLAGIRRHKDTTVLKFIIWSAYMLADTMALYALGHMSLVSGSPEQQLMALWAPLLLVHLGGQDNITAYAIEDNRLWLRHLQTFGVQVLAAAYVLYVSSILSSRTWLRLAAILMFVAGVLKYGERVWALMCASNSASSSLSATSYKDFHTGQHQQLEPEGHGEQHQQLAPEGHGEQHQQLAPEGDHQGNQKDLLFIAYMLLDVPKQLFEGPTRYVNINMDYSLEGWEMSEVVGMQLSMMYDLLYTKAAVVHSWYGRCIRVITLPAMVTALLLFHRSSDKDVYRRVDVVVTYVLLGGAVVLETTSVLRAIFSRWTYALLLEKKCVWLSHVVRRGIQHTSDMGGYMGQHDLFWLCFRSRYSICSKVARWMGREDWWDSMLYSWSTRVPEKIIKKVVELVSTTETGQFDITNSRGRNALRRHSSVSVELDLEWSVELELDESILVWHIATHFFISWCLVNVPRSRVLARVVENHRYRPTETLSNYMLFLLAARPYMLPYPVSRQRYVQLCHDVINHLMKYTSTEDLMTVDECLVAIYPQGISANPILDSGFKLAASLINYVRNHGNVDQYGTISSGVLGLICEVWVEILCYTAYWCNENSHAKNLSSGGDIMTITSLLMIYSSSGLINKKERSQLAPDTPAAPTYDDNV